MVVRGRKTRVAVLMGGISSERDVSLSTGRQILTALDPDKYQAVGVDAALIAGSAMKPLRGSECKVEAVSQAQEALNAAGGLASVQDIAVPDSPLRPDVVFVALHGRYGEDGTIQGMLELLGIPYTGSGVLASALAMDKSMAKKVLEADGIRVPPSVDFEFGSHDWKTVQRDVAATGFPVMVKPSRQGSTIGMTKVNAPDGLKNAISKAGAYDSRIVVEKFIEGTELTVGVLGNAKPFALPVVEIVPKNGFYDYEAKYTPGATDEIVPARIQTATAEEAQALAISAHKTLGCRGMSRVDMICGRDGLYVLELNTIPGMTPTSLLPTAAAAAGIPFAKLLDMILEYALEEGTDT